VHPREVQVDLGVVQTGPDDQIRGWVEKPRYEYLCSMGINIFTPGAMSAIEPDEPLDFPELVQRLLDRGERVLSFRDACYWLDIGQHDDYLKAQDEFVTRRAQFLPDEQ
jgi:NDP-sugar pyrophosphorylase family protein